MNVFCSTMPQGSETTIGDDTIPITLYGNPCSESGYIGVAVLELLKKMKLAPTPEGWSFLNLALSVVAADSFVVREKFRNGWSRKIDLTVPVSDCEKWRESAGLINRMLTFLTGDIWRVSFVRDRRTFVEYSLQEFRLRLPSDYDCVCLFSGGLDSFVGALDLLADKRRPILVSQAYPKEGMVQKKLVQGINRRGKMAHFNPNINPKLGISGNDGHETSSRGRSIAFIGLAVACLTGLQVRGQDVRQLFVPENGFISINAPLILRRIGSLSTRTTHPYYFQMLGKLFANLGMDIELCNPYQYKTKGEMIRECRRPRVLRELIWETYSCGKGKRQNCQCGRCVPCLIRRASIKKAGWEDQTRRGYRFERIKEDILDNHFDDVLAFEIAISRYLENPSELREWVLRSAPFPFSLEEKDGFVNVVSRGLNEVSEFLYA